MENGAPAGGTRASSLAMRLDCNAFASRCCVCLHLPNGAPCLPCPLLRSTRMLRWGASHGELRQGGGALWQGEEGSRVHLGLQRPFTTDRSGPASWAQPGPSLSLPCSICIWKTRTDPGGCYLALCCLRSVVRNQFMCCAFRGCTIAPNPFLPPQLASLCSATPSSSLHWRSFTLQTQVG